MSNEHKIQFPFFQIKSGGQVIDHTNSEEGAIKTFREACVKPAQMWLIQSNGASTLLRQIL